MPLRQNLKISPFVLQTLLFINCAHGHDGGAGGGTLQCLEISNACINNAGTTNEMWRMVTLANGSDA